MSSFLSRALSSASRRVPDSVKDFAGKATTAKGMALGGLGALGGAKAWDYAWSQKDGSPAVEAAAETLRNIWAPAMATAVASGAAGGLLASRSHNPGETTAERRRRILNNALLAGAAGGTAVAAIPTAHSLLTNPATYRDKYGSGGIFGTVAGGMTNIAKYGAGLGGGILAMRYGAPFLKIPGLAAKNKAVRAAADHHLNAFGRQLESNEGRLFTAAKRILKDPDLNLDGEDAELLRTISDDLPRVAGRMANRSEISEADLGVLKSLRGKQVSDEVKTILSKKYELADDTFVIRDDVIDGLPNLVRQAGRNSRDELGRTGNFFDFVNPGVNNNTRTRPFHKVADPADMDNTLKTWTGRNQALGYLGAGLGGHTAYHSIVPSF